MLRGFTFDENFIDSKNKFKNSEKLIKFGVDFDLNQHSYDSFSLKIHKDHELLSNIYNEPNNLILSFEAQEDVYSYTLRAHLELEKPGRLFQKLFRRIFRRGNTIEETISMVITRNKLPIARPGQAQVVSPNTSVLLNGAASEDPDGSDDELTYRWSLTGKPSGSNATLPEGFNSAAKESFVVDLPGEYVVTLIVNDGIEDSASATVTVMATEDLDGDGLVDWWEYNYWDELQEQDSSGDPDQDGFSNLEEFELGTNPTIGFRNGFGFWVDGYAQTMLADFPAAANQMVNFCLDNNIRVIYLKTDNLLSSSNHRNWHALLAKFNHHGIKVEALIAALDGSMPHAGVHELQAIIDYQKASVGEPNHLFAGVHWSINAAHADAHAHEYLNLVVRLLEQRDARGFTASSLPFTWDLAVGDPVYADHYYDPETGEEKLLWQHLLDYFENVNFLTYTDRVRPLIETVRAPMSYIASMDEPPLVRFTQSFADIEKGDAQQADRSFLNEDLLTVINQRQQVESIYGQYEYFQGWSLKMDNDIEGLSDQFIDWNLNNYDYAYPPVINFSNSLNHETITITSDPESIIEQPVYVRLRIKADANLANTSINNSVGSNLLSILPVGLGYAQEGALEDLMGNYDGIAPKSWPYYDAVAWWTDLEPGLDELKSRGLCWSNPANDRGSHCGVQRDIILQEGLEYRFILAHNGSDVIGGNFVSISLAVINPEGLLGNDFTTPLTIDIYLDESLNYELSGVAHLNGSLLIHDTDSDGISDGEESLWGLDPFFAESFIVPVLPYPTDLDWDGLVDGTMDLDGDSIGIAVEYLGQTSNRNFDRYSTVADWPENIELEHAIQAAGGGDLLIVLPIKGPHLVTETQQTSELNPVDSIKIVK